MIDKPDKSQLGSRPRVTGPQSAGVSHSRHSVQKAGHQPADREAYERGDEQGRVPRRQPGPVDKET
jgi:hypothetical protein